VVSVRDYGIGISPDALSHIFEPSYRAPEALASTPGLGLGLSIAREIALRHGGTIDVRRGEPVGTIFSLRVPLCLPHESSRPSAAENLTSAGSR
jgi:signal transduction histidine kinase